MGLDPIFLGFGAYYEIFWIVEFGWVLKTYRLGFLAYLKTYRVWKTLIMENPKSMNFGPLAMKETLSFHHISFGLYLIFF